MLNQQLLPPGGGVKENVLLSTIHDSDSGVGDMMDNSRAQIAQALSASGAFLGARQRGPQHRRQNGDDRDDDEKFDEGECGRQGCRGEIPQRPIRQRRLDGATSSELLHGRSGLGPTVSVFGP